jgi:hypothetical protein
MRNAHYKTWNVVKSEIRGTLDTHTVGVGMWRENLKKLKNETQTLFDLEYGEKHSKTWKMRNKHFRK